MNRKKKRKIWRRKVGFLFIKFFTFLSGAMPLKVNLFLGKVFGVVAYLTLLRHRKVALESLALAFPESSLKERKKIAKKFLVFMMEGGFELLHYLYNVDKVERAVKVEGKSCLDQALAKGKGVILVSAHYGNFPLMGLRLAAAGYLVNFVARPMRDKYAEGHFHKLRTNAGVKTISAYPRRACVSGIIKALAANEIVVIQMDQNFGSGGVWVDFFGKLAATPTGPIVLALRSQAALVCGYILQKEKGKHAIKLFPEEKLIQGKNKGETVLFNAAKFTKIIESWIKENPEQWSWIHRRWKSRPPPSANK